MIPRTNLTARDYLNMAGIKPSNGGLPVTTRRFSEVLKAVAGQQASGLTIQDYLKNPLPAREVISRKSSVAPVKSDTTVHPIQKQSRSLKPLSAIPEKRSATGIEARIARSINTAAAKYRLPAALIRGVVRAESNFQVRATSPAGAQGLMQLMPGTAKELGVTNPFDIDQNIDGGSRYLRQMLDRFGGDTKLALAAYNAGPGTVQKYNGNVPYRETRNYVQKVLRFTEKYSA